MINWGGFSDKIKPSPKQEEATAATFALMRTRSSIYNGTASDKKVAKRRAKNKVAGKQRRVNRRS